jgi:hypothetical protein
MEEGVLLKTNLAPAFSAERIEEGLTERQKIYP